MKLISVRDFDLTGAKVLLRADFNVPMEHGKIVDDFKIKQVLPTIDLLLKQKCRIVIATHFGRPDGDRAFKFSVKPMYEYLDEHYYKRKISVKFVKSEINADIAQQIYLDKAEIIVLENLRFDNREEQDSKPFAKLLAKMADVYVNDAFAVSHRKAASVSAIAKELPVFAGLNFVSEIENLTKALKAEKPAIALLGGVKLETKLVLLKTFLEKYNFVLTGGGIAISLLNAAGYFVGSSISEKEYLNRLKPLLKKNKLILPIDVVVADKATKNNARVVRIGKDKIICAKNEEILDIGPETIKLYCQKIASAKTIVWNGPVGFFENKKFSHGTLTLAKAIGARASGKAFGIAGGGETLAAIEQSRMGRYYDFLSTGGGAMMEFLAGKELPGVKPLMK